MSLQFSEDGPAFPNALVDAMLSGDVVFLCGAGVSAPQLPMFGALVNDVYKRLGLEQTTAESNAATHGRYEETLGTLSRRLVNPDQMYQEVADILSLKTPDLEHHKTLLRLSRTRDNRVMLVTTNFDTLFERAVIEVEGMGCGRVQSLAGQALPPPGGIACHGIIHLHGRIHDEVTQLEKTPLVLTSAEYGDAYMRSGWASRFLFDLARCKTLVMIGYSANDAPVRYFLNLLEGDRVRFGDLKNVYAVDSYVSDPRETEARWATVAVTSLPYRKAKSKHKSGDHHEALWRDLAQLADLVERPKARRRERAAAILQKPCANLNDLQRDEVEWLFFGKGDLWDIVISNINDPAWFDYFDTEKIWKDADASRVVVNWCCLALTSSTRFEVAIKWNKRFGRGFTEALHERLVVLLEKTPAPWNLAWKLLCRSPRDTVDVQMRSYRLAQALKSPLRIDDDVKKAVYALTPRIELEPLWRLNGGEGKDAGQKGSLRDIARVSLTLDDRTGMTELNVAIRSIPGYEKRLAQLCTQALQDAAASACDVGLITPDWDSLDCDVPAVEDHEQNNFHGGVVHLCVLLTDLLHRLAVEDPEYSRRIANSWRDMPGLVGQRLWVHALRNPELFSCDDAAEHVLALPSSVFWHVRRELVLTLEERLHGASPKNINKIVERILNESPFLYLDVGIEQGTDWRPYARDRRVWLLLTAIKSAGVLPQIGLNRLEEIAVETPNIVGDYEERDLFGGYSTGVRVVQGDPRSLLEVMPDERLDVARSLMDKPDFSARRSWSAYCSSDPDAAFLVLVGGNISQENMGLWHDFLNALVATMITSDVVRTDVVCLTTKVFAALNKADDEFVAGLLSPLSHLFSIYDQAEQNPAVTGAWWDRLWMIAENHEQSDGQGGGGRFFDRVLNSPSGRLVERLLLSINKRLGPSGISADERERLQIVVTSDTPAGRLGRGWCARNAGFLLHVAPRIALGVFRKRLALNSVEGAALRAVLISSSSLSFVGARAYKAQLFMTACEPKLPESDAILVAARVLQLLLSWRMSPNMSKPPVTTDEIRELLMRAPYAVLVGSARFLSQSIGEIGGSPESSWTVFIKPVFEEIWPNEARFKRASVARWLAVLCIGAGSAFRDAFQTIHHFLTPIDGDGEIASCLKQSGITRSNPDTCLELLWLVYGPGAVGRAFELAEVLDQIVASNPSLEIDRRLQWLEQHRVTRYQ